MFWTRGKRPSKDQQHQKLCVGEREKSCDTWQHMLEEIDGRLWGLFFSDGGTHTVNHKKVIID